MRTRRRGFIGHLEGDEFFFHAIRLLFGQHGATNEFALVERDKKSDASLNRRGVLVQFVAVKRIANFRAQRVARAEAGGLQAERLADGEQFIPQMLDGFVAADDFKSVLARVAGARNQNIVCLKIEAADLVFLQIRHPADPRTAGRLAGNAVVDEFSTRGPCTATAA